MSPAFDAGGADLQLCQWHFLLAADRTRDLAQHRGSLCCGQPACRSRHDCGLPPGQQGSVPAVLLLGTVSIDRTKIDVHASTTRSVRHDRLEAEAGAEAEAARPAYEANKAADEAKTERRGQPPTPRRLWPAPMRRALPQLSWAWKQRSACPVWSWPTRALPAARRWPTCKHAGSSRCWPLDGPSGIGPMTSVRRHCRKHRGGSLNPSTSP